MSDVFDVQKVQNHEPGWEEEWNRIVAALLAPESKATFEQKNPKLEDGRLFQACMKATHHAQDTDGFFSEIFTQYVEKAHNQTLFPKFDVLKTENVLYFLCSVLYLRKLYKEFRRKSRISATYFSEQEQSVKKGKRVSDLPDLRILPMDEMAVVLEQRHAFWELEKDLDSLVISCRKSPKRIRQQAGLQLYPRLSTTDKDMLELRDSVCGDVTSIHGTSREEAETLLRNTHKNVAENLCEKIITKRNDLLEKRFKSSSKLEKCRKQLNELVFDRFFCPLQVSEVMLLLKFSEMNAAQCRSRYHREIRSLLEVYFKRFEHITELDTEEYHD